MPARRVCRAALALGLLALGGVALAQHSALGPGNPALDRRFKFSLGGYLINFDTMARLDSEALGRGTEIDFEDDLKLDSETSDLRLDGHWRFSPRHRLEFSVISIARDASATLDEEIQFGDEIYEVDGEVSARFDTDVYKIAYRGALLRRERTEIGFSAGISAFRFEARVAASGSVGGGSGSGSAESESLVAPVPAFGLYADIRLSERAAALARVDFFDLSTSGWEGSFLQTTLLFEYFPWERFGFGLGYDRVKITYNDLEDPDFLVEYRYGGALLYTSYSF